MKTKISYVYDAKTKEFIGESEVYESPLEKGKYLLSPNAALIKPIGNENVWDGSKWIYKKKYVGIFYNKQTKNPEEINTFDLPENLTEKKPKEFDDWVDNDWVENVDKKNQRSREIKLQSKFQKELDNLIWKEVKKNNTDLDEEDLAEIDKKIK